METLDENYIPNVEYQKYTNVSQVQHQGIHQPDANIFYVSTGSCDKILPIIFLIVGIGLSLMKPFIDGIPGIFMTIFGVIITLISFYMMFKFYYNVYLIMGPNDLTVTKKALCSKKTKIYLPGNLISVLLTKYISHTNKQTFYNYTLNIKEANGSTETIFSVRKNSVLFTEQEIGYFNYVINVHIQNKIRV